ncbi:hypothetical protein PSHT_13730 [Puccinia striiformis]|uniref:Uncharacterized protein n=1 Tax=Puccinia striiformis TaxID=27350 RepID=A0A2S4UP70_9BASI|nr:hypothetical protein PSHT_13730 [Puccinia striiformis]
MGLSILLLLQPATIVHRPQPKLQPQSLLPSINDNHHPPALLLYWLVSFNSPSLLFPCCYDIRASIDWKTS